MVFILQCVNELPKTQEFWLILSSSIILPMLKLFTGRERKYIKHDYLKRKGSRICSHCVLHMDLNELPIPEAFPHISPGRI